VEVKRHKLTRTKGGKAVP